MVVSGKKTKTGNRSISSLTAVGSANSAQISSNTDLPLLTKTCLPFKGFLILHFCFPKRYQGDRIETETESDELLSACLNSLHCFLECVLMQLSPTLLCCMSSHPSGTLFDHQEPGKTHCLLIEETRNAKQTEGSQ